MKELTILPYRFCDLREEVKEVVVANYMTTPTYYNGWDDQFYWDDFIEEMERATSHHANERSWAEGEYPPWIHLLELKVRDDGYDNNSVEAQVGFYVDTYLSCKGYLTSTKIEAVLEYTHGAFLDAIAAHDTAKVSRVTAIANQCIVDAVDTSVVDALQDVELEEHGWNEHFFSEHENDLFAEETHSNVRCFELMEEMKASLEEEAENISDTYTDNIKRLQDWLESTERVRDGFDDGYLCEEVLYDYKGDILEEELMCEYYSGKTGERIAS